MVDAGPEPTYEEKKRVPPGTQGSWKTHIVIIVQTQWSCNIVQT